MQCLSFLERSAVGEITWTNILTIWVRLSGDLWQEREFSYFKE